MRASYSKKANSFVWEGVDLWTHLGVRQAVDLHVKDGILVRIHPSHRRSGQIVVPAGVDAQVHLRVPGQPEKETADSGCLAALHGGVGCLLTMPNTRPFIDSVEVLRMAQDEVAPLESEFGIHVLFSACITKSQQGKQLTDFDQLISGGASALTDDGRGVCSDEIMEAAIRKSHELGVPLLQHAETEGAEGPLAPGPVQSGLGLKPYSETHETEMIARDLRLLEKYPKARYHVLHLSSAKSIELVVKAKVKGLNVTCEVTPHHLYFSSDDIEIGNKSFKMNPPLRSAADRAELVRALADGRIDWMATDHAPHEYATKDVEFSKASFGTTGLETSLQVLLDLVLRGDLTPERFVEVWSKAPADYFQLSEYGRLVEGHPFRAVLVDTSETQTISEKSFWGLSKNSCFLGKRLPGRILAHATRTAEFRFDEP